ncbi:MAG TPA: hypothetical protein VF800_01555 [Telluria sp.]|jgi:hypothetical protein
MVRIRQHGAGGELFDLNMLIADVDALIKVDEWQVSVSECLGDGAADVEALGVSRSGLIASEDLRNLYKHVYQTIDGEFTGLRAGKESCRLVAVDSSYWEVFGPSEFEAAVLLKYGPYVR